MIISEYSETGIMRIEVVSPKTHQQLTSELLNPTNAILRLRPSFVLSILQSVSASDGMLECKCCFTLDSLNEGGRFFMHIRVVDDVDDEDGSDVMAMSMYLKLIC